MGFLSAAKKASVCADQVTPNWSNPPPFPGGEKFQDQNYSLRGGFQQKDDPLASMDGIFTYIYHKNQPNVGKYTIHGWYGERFVYHQYLSWGGPEIYQKKNEIYEKNIA